MVECEVWDCLVRWLVWVIRVLLWDWRDLRWVVRWVIWVESYWLVFWSLVSCYLRVCF
jgi:hypothetical protein